MAEILFSKVDLMWHCDPNDYPRDPFDMVYLILKVTDANTGEVRCVLHDTATYDPDSNKWSISYCNFGPKGRDDDGEWKVLAWAYKPTTAEMVSVDLWQRLLEANREE